MGQQINFQKSSIHCSRNVRQEKKEELLSKLGSLQHNSIVGDIAKTVGKTKETITLKELQEATAQISFKLSFGKYERWINEYKRLPGNSSKGISEIYEKVRK